MAKSVACALRGIVAAGAILQFSAAHAEEGGSGHYFPGSIASFIDAVPPAPTFIARLNVLAYDGGFSANRTVPIAQLLVADVDIKSQAYGMTFVWRPTWGGEGAWSYAMSTTIPFVNLEVDGRVQSPGVPVAVRKSDSASGLGDIILMPLMLKYKVNADLSFDGRLSFIAPTGSYETGRLANTGKNFWTVEPYLGAVYFGTKNGIEASAYIGADFNEENSATNYRSGTQVHADATLAQHFPLWGGLAGAGVSAFWYQQASADSGRGATLGDFEARTNGIGPVISFASKVGGRDAVAELKWLHEFDVERRPRGDTIFFKALLKF